MKKWKVYACSLFFLGILAGCTSEQNNNIPDNKESNLNVEEDLNKENSEDPTVTPEQSDISGNISEEKERPTVAEAVFLNSIPLRQFDTLTEEDRDKSGFLVNPSQFDYNYSGDYTQVVSLYEYDEKDETLYAFWVRIGNYVGEKPEDVPLRKDYETDAEYMEALIAYDSDVLLESMKQTEILVVENYPYTVKGAFVESLENYDNENGVLAPAVVGTMKELKAVFGTGEAVNGRNYQLLPATRPDIGEIAKAKGYTGEITMFTFEDIAGTEKYVTVTVEVE